MSQINKINNKMPRIWSWNLINIKYIYNRLTSTGQTDTGIDK